MKSKHLAACLASALLGGALLLGWHGLASPVALASQPGEAAAQKEDPRAEKEKGFLAAISRREKELDARDGELRRKEERLGLLKLDMETRLKEIMKVHQEIESMVRKLNEADDEKVRKIVKIYESMSPEDAASRIEGLDREMAVMILSAMSERKAAKILGLVDVSKSVELSKLFKPKK